MTHYIIDHEDTLPFGILNNNFNYDFKLNNETWRNCSQYIYVNCLRYILNYNVFFSHREDKYIDQMNKSPTYETYGKLLNDITNDIKYNYLYSNILGKLNTAGFDTFIASNDISALSPALQNVIVSIRSNLTIKKYYNYYPSYLVIKIIRQFLLDDLEDFTKIQQYLISIENKKNSNIFHDIIKDYGFNRLQKLAIYDFEYEVESDKELHKVLELSHCYPNILFIYAFKYDLRHFKNRMEFKYRNKILELFLKYKNKYTESIKKEIYLVHNRKLKDIIIDQVLNYDDKFRKYVDKDVPLRQIISSMISEQKLHEYENFNFDIEISPQFNFMFSTAVATVTNSESFPSYLTTLDASFDNERTLPENLEKMKQVLATIAVHKKFQIPLPQNQLDNYTANLPLILKPHVKSFNDSINESEEDNRFVMDMKCMLYYIRGVPLKFDTEDSTLARFVGPLISNLSMISPFRPTDMAIYRDNKVNIKTILQEDLFFNLWLKRQLQYVSHLLSCLTLFLEMNSIDINNSSVHLDILKIFSGSQLFTKTKTSYDEIPSFFCELLEYHFNTDAYDEEDKKTFAILIWNFVTYNLQLVLKTRDIIKTKSYIIKNILRLRLFHQCVENQDNNDIACYTFAVINVGNKMKQLMDKYNITLKTSNVEKYVEAVILNTKSPVYDDDYRNDEESKDIKKIVNEIFVQNEAVVKSYLSQEQIVKLINNTLKNEDDKYKINMWVTLSF